MTLNVKSVNWVKNRGFLSLHMYTTCQGSNVFTWQHLNTRLLMVSIGMKKDPALKTFSCQSGQKNNFQVILLWNFLMILAPGDKFYCDIYAAINRVLSMVFDIYLVPEKFLINWSRFVVIKKINLTAQNRWKVD